MSDKKCYCWNVSDDDLKQWELYEGDLKEELTKQSASYLREDALQAQFNPPLTAMPVRQRQQRWCGSIIKICYGRKVGSG